MPVVINEFEVVAEGAPAPAQARPDEGEPKRAGDREPPDLLELLAEERRRDERVRAT